MSENSTLKTREKMGIAILLFVLKIINPTSYQHEVAALHKQIMDLDK